MNKKLVFFIVIVFFAACSSREPVQTISVKIKTPPQAQLEWTSGETVELTGTIWPSRAYTKYYIDTDDGKSAHLKSDLIDKLEAGTKLFLTGTVEYVNDVGTAGASMVKHSQTYFFVKVSDYKILDDTE